ncbi:Na+/H+ antiporter subunit E [Cellulomonas chengniuliangii]|uniref:Na+/H+ antiporter subunit E n=1 Tax=Cellulomonas chengniuliangii TaxID=2968084 RepID=A0ABY5KZL6_9CELL|nr:Na+/H+ antiporter subunit E [Cellulomonas chengniuliangii]MCC2309281.1 Na+/H+ antiporter subunit E [Cellulomonas chengniuliangii]MCC2316543.1 Na+/H+ antiporter subunit E [Cellulomonas chengniuliangii]UUI75150.1 Na+/H+ antiporter subunit E [Cellulomonas chengniuliangii]
MSPSRRRSVIRQWPTVVWLAFVWMMLWGSLSVANLIVGLLIGVLVTGGLRMTPIVFHGRVRPLGLMRLVGRFAFDLVRASFEVSLLALRPGHVPHGAVIGVQLRSHSDLYLTLTSELSSLVPGSLVVEAHRLTGKLYLHVLDVEQSGGVEKARQTVLAQEERVLRAFASDEELRQAGLPLRPARGRRGEGVNA